MIISFKNPVDNAMFFIKMNALTIDETGSYLVGKWM